MARAAATRRNQSLTGFCSTPATRSRHYETESAGRSNIPGTCGGWTSYPVSPRPPAAPAPAARLRFDRITQLWLRDLGKRWTRLRLTSGLSIGAARAGVDALIRFSDFLTLTGVDRLADVDRPLLERYLARRDVPARRTRREEDPGSARFNLFLPGRPPTPWDDTARRRRLLRRRHPTDPRTMASRRLGRFVMTQVESPTNLDRWPEPSAGWSRSSSPVAACGSPAP